MRRLASSFVFVVLIAGSLTLGGCPQSQELGTADASGDGASTADGAPDGSRGPGDGSSGLDVATLDVTPATDSGVPADSTTGVDTSAPVDAGTDAIVVRDGGSCSDAAAVPGTTRPFFDQAVHICGMYAACAGDGDTFPPCVEWLSRGLDATSYRAFMHDRPFVFTADDRFPQAIFLAQAEPGVRACLAAATTCDAMFACQNAGAPSTACTISGGLAPNATCSGSTLHVCGYTGEDMEVSGATGGPARPRTFSFDCSTVGSPCVTGGAVPVASPHGVGCAAAACDFPTHAPSCSGSTGSNCNVLGLLDTFVCPTGSTCQVVTLSGAANAVCVGSGPACDEATFVPRCACDGTMIQCMGGHEGPMTCPYGACVVGSDGAATCRDGSVCPVDGITCDASSGRITACLGGRQGVVDCRAMGYSGCGPGTFSSGTFCQ